ncbi:MAG: hypothetical protein J0M12_05695 [Deltaproteobacteria bacterium]|nr:hypothetical protein [Deltaproteobacteria bacterium]
MKKLVTALIIAVLFLVPLYVRTLIAAQSSLAQGEAQLQQNQYAQAFESFRTSLSWSAPFNPFSPQAEEHLRAFAFDISQATEVRLEALQALLRGLRSSRSFLRPASDSEVILVRNEIERLSVAEGAQPSIVKDSPPEPNFTYQWLAQLLFWCWLASVIVSIFRGFTADGTPRRGALMRGAVVSFALYALWLCALGKA